MAVALDEARRAIDLDEVPVGAVVVHDGQIVAQGTNLTNTLYDPTAHAEIIVLREAAAKLGTHRLAECDLYVTLEPCTMCAGAISHARIRRLYFGAYDLKGGAVTSGVRFFSTPTCHHAPEIYDGISEREAAALLRDFFQNKRG